MSADLPDWTKAVLLLAQTGAGAYIPVLVEDGGQLHTLLVGQDAGGTKRVVRVDSVGQLYAILRGASGNDVAVDSNGFLTAVLKGIKDSTLTTIAVDDQGRIEAFGLDAESQWGNVLKVGNAEQASRLGSPSSYDWRGQCLEFCTFVNGRENLYVTTSGAGAAVTVDPEYSLRGGFSLKMLGGSDASMWAKVQGIVGKNPSQAVGLQVCWSGENTYDYFEIRVSVRGPTTRYTGALRYDPGSNDFDYYDNAGSWQKLADVYLTNYPYAFNYIKLVVDASTGDYVRALLNATEYDLSAYTLYSDVLGFQECIEYSLTVYSVAGQNYGVYVDSYIVTLNEPT